MILIRGIKGKEYAAKIDSGIVSFRDLLSTLMNTNHTGYLYSDYYEKYFIEAFCSTMQLPMNFYHFEPRIRSNILLMLNQLIPHIYITYFHILNDNSLDWINSFDPDTHFFYFRPNIDNVSGNLIGNNLFGRQLEYAESISLIRQCEFNVKSTGLLKMINNDISHLKDPVLSMNYATQFFNIMLPLFTREINDKFKQDENEFRVIYKPIIKIDSNNGQFLVNQKRKYDILLHDSLEYEGYFDYKVEFGVRKCDISLTAKSCLLNQQKTRLIDTIMDGNSFSLLSEFKDVNITSIAAEYGYIGSKKDCKNFIKLKFK